MSKSESYKVLEYKCLHGHTFEQSEEVKYIYFKTSHGRPTYHIVGLRKSGNAWFQFESMRAYSGRGLYHATFKPFFAPIEIC